MEVWGYRVTHNVNGHIRSDEEVDVGTKRNGASRWAMSLLPIRGTDRTDHDSLSARLPAGHLSLHPRRHHDEASAPAPANAT